MLTKTRGIVLHTIKYGDTSLIAHVYTEEFGRQSYMVKGAYRKNAIVKANLFYPLSLLNLDIYYKDGKELQIIKEAQNFPVLNNIPMNPFKNSISLFLSEILYRCLREEEGNPRLFSFIYNAIQLLDLKKEISDFHIAFLIQLTKFLGFYPLNNYSDNECIFDLKNGLFVSDAPQHGYYIHTEESKLFNLIIVTNFDEIEKLRLKREERQYFLEKIIDFYRLHIEGMGIVKSLQIFKEVFD